MNKKILVAEDIKLNYLLIECILSRYNVDILWAMNGEEAVTLYKENPDISVILMDINMPVMNGITATKIIKTINPNIIIIAVSAYYTTVVDKNIFDNYLEKPFLERQLIKLIDDLSIPPLVKRISK